MGVNYLFIALSPDRENAASVPLAEFLEVFRRFNIPVDHLASDPGDGSHPFDFHTPQGAPSELWEQGSFSIRNGGVTSFGLYRPSSPDGPQLWLALLNVGFAMMPDYGHPVFASPKMARDVGYLNEISSDGVVRVVERVEDFVF